MDKLVSPRFQVKMEIVEVCLKILSDVGGSGVIVGLGPVGGSSLELEFDFLWSCVLGFIILIPWSVCLWVMFLDCYKSVVFQQL